MCVWRKHFWHRQTIILVLLPIWLYSLFSEFSEALSGFTSISSRSWKASNAQIYGNIMIKKIPRLHTFQVQALRSNYFNRKVHGFMAKIFGFLVHPYLTGGLQVSVTIRSPPGDYHRRLPLTRSSIVCLASLELSVLRLFLFKALQVNFSHWHRHRNDKGHKAVILPGFFGSWWRTGEFHNTFWSCSRSWSCY